MISFSEILQIPTGVTAVVGGGGKTTLMMRLAQELSKKHKVLVTTTTHIWQPECFTVLSPDQSELAVAFLQHNLVVAGEPAADGKLSMPQRLGVYWRNLAEYVLVEADGSRGLPLKAPAENEPVLPPDACLVIAVAGMSCVGQPIRLSAHRPERYAALSGLPEDETITPQAVAKVLENTCGQRKGVNSAFRILLNQTDTPTRLAFARQTARLLHADTVLTALQAHPGWAEIWADGVYQRTLNEEEERA